MTDAETELSGRLSAIEYLLEVMLANELSLQPEASTTAFKRNLLSRRGHNRPDLLVDAAAFQAAHAACEAGLARILERVSEREAELRVARATGG